MSPRHRLRVVRGSDSGPPHDGEALIEEAAALFGRQYRRSASREEARLMMDRLTRSFALLVEWDGAEPRELRDIA